MKKKAVVLFLMALPMQTWAAGLGALNVNSALGEPLKATIDILSATPEEKASLKAQIATQEAYSAQGLERTDLHQNIKMSIGKVGGKDVVKLHTNKPVSEPFLDMLVVLDWNNGRIQRQYTALLDPPNYQPNADVVNKPSIKPLKRTPATRTVKRTTTRPAAKAFMPSARPRAAVPQSHLTKKGDTLYKIARRMQPAGVSLDKVLVALFEANPGAFDRKNMNRLKVGKILQAPSAGALDAMSGKHAKQEIRLHTADWNKYRNKLAAAVAKKPAQASGEDTQSTSGKIKSAAEDESAPKGDEAKDVVKLSATDDNNQNTDMKAKITALQEEVSAREKGLKEAADRTAALEKQIEDMKKLLALKNNTLANAQDQAEQKVTDETQGDAKVEAEGAVKAAKPLESDAQVNDPDTAKPEVAEVVAEKPSAKTQVTEKPETVATAEEKQPSFFSSLVDNGLNLYHQFKEMILAALAALLLLLLAVWLYFRNKRSKELEDLEQGIMTSGSLKENTVFGDTASGMAATGDTSFLTDFSHSTGSGLIDTNDVDPIAEAEVYMAYGRDAQAEEILKDAISKEPQRYELHSKLLEMYAANKNTSAFEAVAGDVYTTLGADDPTWTKVAEMGAKLDPANPLYQKDGSAVTQQADTVSPEPELAKAVEMSPEQPAEVSLEQASMVQSAAAVSVAEAAVTQAEPTDDALDASDFSDSPLAAEADLDFSMSDSADESEIVAGVDDIFVADSEPVRSGSIAEAMTEKEPALQFNLEMPKEVAQSLESDAESLDFPILEMQDNREAAVTMEEANNDASTVAEATNDLTLDMPKDDAPDVEVNMSSGDAAEGFDFGLDEEVKPEFAAPAANVLDMSDISLDISDEVSFAEEPEVAPAAVEETAPDATLAPEFEEVETKLELVAAYIDMEDKDGAKELLEEVLKEGNLGQRKRADQMLSSLA